MLHIGISGAIASGKSTLAMGLKGRAQQAGYDARIIGFATGIREIVAVEHTASRVPIIANMLSQWGYDATKSQYGAMLIDQYMMEYPSTVGVKNRRLLQSIGGEVGRDSIDVHMWIRRTKHLFKQIPMLDFGFSDDLRHDNEVMAVDVHVAIQLTSERLDCYQQRVKQLDPYYTYNNHASEHSLTLPALLTIPVCFDEADVDTLFRQLNTIRSLRV